MLRTSVTTSDVVIASQGLVIVGHSRGCILPTGVRQHQAPGAVKKLTVRIPVSVIVHGVAGRTEVTDAVEAHPFGRAAAPRVTTGSDVRQRPRDTAAQLQAHGVGAHHDTGHKAL